MKAWSQSFVLVYFTAMSPTLLAQPSDSTPKNSEKWESTKESTQKDSQEASKSQEPPSTPKPQIKEPTKANLSQDFRGSLTHSLLGTYAFIDMWIPGKWGFSYSYHPSASGSYEIEYVRGKLSPLVLEELGTITDERLTVMYRSFSKRNSFNFLYGINYSSLKLQLGSEALATILTGDSSAFDVISIKTLGATWGLGNRWNISRFIVSVDWLVLNIPILSLESEAPFINATSDASKKGDAQDVLDFVEKIPTLSIAKFQLGISF